MLQVASRPIEDCYGECAGSDTVPSPVADHAPVPTATDRYGARSGSNMLVLAVILILHAVLIVAVMQVRHHVQMMKEAKLTVVNLTPPAPPPAADTPPPPPSTPQVVAPPPIVQTPVPPVQVVQTTPDPVPAPMTAATVVAAPTPSAAPAAPPAPPSMIQGGDLSTQMVSGKPPRYPVESRRKREQGTVVLTLTLGLDGAVDSIAISQSSGFTRLDNAARDAVKGWRWKPTIRGGQPVRVKGVVEIPFVLRTDA
ncbi:MAG: energy transducer TonB [bacterium]|nr:energy transducer TonB [bacterium]